MQKQTPITLEQAEELISYYDNGRQVEFVQDVLGSTPWSTQQEIIKAVFEHSIVAVASCNASGKSDLAGDVALAFLSLKPHSIVITTAPTGRQVKNVLWRYIRTKYVKAPIKLSKQQCNQIELNLAEDWFAVGLSTNDAEKFFGYHADDILVIVDEASGVEEPIFIGVDAVTPNLNAHVLMIGNPTNTIGRFAEAFKDPLVKKFNISAFDTPNFTANNIHTPQDLIDLFTPPEDVDAIDHLRDVESSLLSPIPALISPAKAYRRYLQWGMDSPMWEALIMGQFPSQADNMLIPLYLIEQSMNPEYREEHGWQIPSGETEYGVDVARFGSDKTAVVTRRGGHVDPIITWGHLDTVASSERIINTINPELWNTTIKVDDTGLGGGVTDQLNRRRPRTNERDENGNEQPPYRYSVVPINFGAQSAKPEKFYNLRAEMYWTIRELLIAHRIALPEDEELKWELSNIRFEFTGKEQIKLEPKDDIKKRTGKSPDRADALVLAFAKSSNSSWLPIEPPKDHVAYKPNSPTLTSKLSKRY